MSIDVARDLIATPPGTSPHVDTGPFVIRITRPGPFRWSAPTVTYLTDDADQTWLPALARRFATRADADPVGRAMQSGRLPQYLDAAIGCVPLRNC